MEDFHGLCKVLLTDWPTWSAAAAQA